MKKILFCSLLALLAACQSEPPAAAPVNLLPLYIHAPNGLALRKTPSKDGEKIDVLPYNSQALTPLAQADMTNRLTAEQYGPVEIGGGWIKVRTADGQTGYVFEGFLLPWPPMTQSAEGDLSDVEWYYRTISLPAREREKYAPVKESEAFRQRYQDGAIYQIEYYPGGVTELLQLPPGKMTLSQALVLFRPMWFHQIPTQTTWDAAQQQLIVKIGETAEQLTIKQEKDGSLAVKFESAD